MPRALIKYANMPRALIKYANMPRALIKYAKGVNQICLYAMGMYQLKFVIVTNIVSNIYRTFNKFLPNTIIYFNRQRLLQSYLLPMITRKDRNNIFYLYYGSYLSKIALDI